MTEDSFVAFVTSEESRGEFVRRIEQRSIDDLPPGDVLIRVHYSSLNYKDALSASGNRGVTRRYPHTPGIDAAGIVASSAVPEFSPGDQVIVIGHDLGMNTDGGFGQAIRVPAGWVVKRPHGLTLRQSMIYGTAGFTAAMALQQLLRHGVTPDQGEVLVTGATGGVGSLAVALLAVEGFRVVAATGKPEAADFLESLGAAQVVDRQAVTDPSRPLLRERWAGVVDTVGGEMLATAIAAAKHSGCITCCGLVASPKLETTVFPFILRGVTLVGIDSAEVETGFRRRLWEKIASKWKLDRLEVLATEVSLGQIDPEIDRILAGAQRGRILINMQGL